MRKVKTDVLIVGYGFAGAIAAIVAHDAGATVLLSEKMAQFGWCSMLSGGGVTYVQDPEGGFEYFKEMCGGRTPDSVIRAQAHMMAKTVDFIDQLCKVNGAKYAIRARPGTSPSPGRDSLNSLTVREVPGFAGYPWLVPGPGTSQGYPAKPGTSRTVRLFKLSRPGEGDVPGLARMAYFAPFTLHNWSMKSTVFAIMCAWARITESGVLPPHISLKYSNPPS